MALIGAALRWASPSGRFWEESPCWLAERRPPVPGPAFWPLGYRAWPCYWLFSACPSRSRAIARARPAACSIAPPCAALSRPSIGLLLVTSFVAVFSFANFESTLSLEIERMIAVDHSGDLVQEMEAALEPGPVVTNAAPLEPETEIRSAPLRRLLALGESLGYERDADMTLFIVLATFTYLGMILTLAQGFLVRRLSGRLSEGAMATGGAVTAIAGFALLAVAAQRRDFSLLLEAMALEVIGFAFVNPSLQSLLSRRSDPRVQGSILGLGQSMTSLARILGPVFGISLMARRGFALLVGGEPDGAGAGDDRRRRAAGGGFCRARRTVPAMTIAWTSRLPWRQTDGGQIHRPLMPRSARASRRRQVQARPARVRRWP